MNQPIATYAEFWPHYLREHANPRSRALHYIGTALAIALMLAAIILLDPRYLLAAVVAGYFWAWIGHFFIERNRPATFTYPVWSLVSDFRMFFFWLAGRLGPELASAGVRA